MDNRTLVDLYVASGDAIRGLAASAGKLGVGISQRLASWTDEAFYVEVSMGSRSIEPLMVMADVVEKAFGGEENAGAMDWHDHCGWVAQISIAVPRAQGGLPSSPDIPECSLSDGQWRGRV